MEADGGQGRAVEARGVSEAVERAVDVLAGHRIAVLTGAGVSTDSGIPDYRGPNAPRRRPMTFQRFSDDPASRQRYWAGSHLGWRRFAASRPNDGHRAIAALEHSGIAAGVVTQNVDSLHQRAGSRRVVELHGTMHRVVCLRCAQVYARDAIAERIEADNPWVANPEHLRVAPDGDVDVDDFSRFVVPACPVCGGRLKPEVVFFGEFVPPGVFAAAASLIRSADALVVAGSSLAVNSAVRLVERARERALPIVIINRGDTARDDTATVRIEGGVGTVLPLLTERLTS